MKDHVIKSFATHHLHFVYKTDFSSWLLYYAPGFLMLSLLHLGAVNHIDYVVSDFDGHEKR